jgi:hypothetical protein
METHCIMALRRMNPTGNLLERLARSPSDAPVVVGLPV